MSGVLPGSKLEQYSPHAREVLRLAHEEARAVGHAEVEPEHLLLALSLLPDTTAGKILHTLEFRTAGLRTALRQLPLETGSPEGVALSHDTRELLVLADETAQRLKSSHIDTDHLLNALLAQETAGVITLLVTMGVSIQDVRECLIEFVFSEFPEAQQFYRILRLARDEARQTGCTVIEPGHVLLALWSENYPPLMQLFACQGIERTPVEAHIRRLHGSTGAVSIRGVLRRSHDSELLVQEAERAAKRVNRFPMPYDLFYGLMGEHYPLHHLFPRLNINRVKFSYDLTKYGIYWHQPHRAGTFLARLWHLMKIPVKAAESWLHSQK